MAPALLDSPQVIDYARFLEVCRNLNMQASPGFPLCRVYPTIGSFLGDKLNLNETNAMHLYQQVKTRLREVSDADPFRVFMKAEPHKPAKVEQGKWRLIFCSSLVDQVIDHLLFDHLNQKIIDNHPKLPVKPGWSPFAGGLALLKSFENPVATDKSSWDWLYPPWLVTLVFRVRVGLYSNQPRWWLKLAAYRYEQAFKRARILLSSGKVYKQLVPGLMKSGLVNTIVDNSIGQIILHVLASKRAGLMVSPRAIAMGDDELKEWFEDWEEYFSKLTELSKIKEVSWTAEFAGVTSTGDPCHFERNLAHLIHIPDKDLPQALDSYQLNYALSPKLWVVHHLIDRLCPEVKKPILALKHKYLYGGE